MNPNARDVVEQITSMCGNDQFADRFELEVGSGWDANGIKEFRGKIEDLIQKKDGCGVRIEDMRRTESGALSIICAKDGEVQKLEKEIIELDVEDWMLTLEDVKSKIDAYFAEGGDKKLWIGSLETNYDEHNHEQQGRSLSRRAIASSYQEVLKEIVSLTQEVAQDDEDSSHLVTGIFIRPLAKEGANIEVGEQDVKIVCDCANKNQKLYVMYETDSPSNGAGFYQYNEEAGEVSNDRKAYPFTPPRQ